MKKLFLSAFMLMGLAFSAQAQDRNALGLRLGDNDGFGGEISYQRTLASDNRLENLILAGAIQNIMMLLSWLVCTSGYGILTADLTGMPVWVVV
jgi:hypothetical protein